jgi:hypothetical protein
MHQIAFVCHNAEPFIEIPTKPFDKHRVAIFAQQNVTVDLKKVKRFPADAEEFTDFI